MDRNGRALRPALFYDAKELPEMRYALAIIFALFLVLFAAIVVEEVFLGGRRLRKAKKAAMERRQEEARKE